MYKDLLLGLVLQILAQKTLPLEAELPKLSERLFHMSLSAQHWKCNHHGVSWQLSKMELSLESLANFTEESVKDNCSSIYSF